jgi:hypothetical protein
VLTLLCRGGIAGIDVGNAAADDDPFRVVQQKTGQGKALVTEHLRVPQRRIAELFDALRQVD